MSIDKEKNFVMKHDFNNLRVVSTIETKYGEEEEHFGIPWRISGQIKLGGVWGVYLECLIPCNSDDWSIETAVKFGFFEIIFTFTNTEKKHFLMDFHEHPGTDNYPVAIPVKILNINGNFRLKKNRKFNESNKKYSDVVLKVKDEKFYVLKQFLAYNSAYFESLFFGNFDESGQSEVELKDIKPYDFQNYLELIHGETSVEHNAVKGILHLADFFGTKSAIRRCEDFLLDTSEKTLKQKFGLANKYRLGELMEKCLLEIKTEADARSVIPSDPKDLSHEKSADEENKFVMKHLFRDLDQIRLSGPIYGKEEEHFRFLWSLSVAKGFAYHVSLECLNPCNSDDWSIEATVSSESFKKVITFTNADTKHLLKFIDLSQRSYEYSAEFTVKINKINGFALRNWRNFHDESNKKYSDVVLKVNDQKFYVLKQFLAYHSTYFESLFFGNFDESKRSEVELKDIDPCDFQNYLELIHGETLVDDNTVEEILYLADFFDSKIAMKRCEEFLLKNSQKTLKQQFELANKYGLDKLMKSASPESKQIAVFARLFLKMRMI